MSVVTGCDLELSFAFKDLVSRDVFSKSDPFIEVFLVNPNSRRGELIPLGKSKALKDESTGSWPETFPVKFKFEEKQQICARVYDYDSTTNHDLIGEVVFILGTLMGQPGQKCAYSLARRGSGGTKGQLIVLGEKVILGSSGVLTFQLESHKLEAKDFMGFGKSDPYFKIDRLVGSDQWMNVMKSGYIKNNCSPVWPPVSIPLGKIATNGDMNCRIRISVYDYDDGSNDDLIGELSLSLDDFVNSRGKQLDVRHPPTKRKYKKASYKNSGTISVRSARIDPPPQSLMLDYIAGGLEINLMVFVDFTASNGDPRDPRSLHHTSTSKLNAYQAAITEVGTILQSYDRDGQIPCFGFGGVYRGATSHCFPLNPGHPRSEVQGIHGVLQAYNNAITTVPLSGPTYFAPMLNTVNQLTDFSEMSQQMQRYSIVLILTDGAIMDLQPTIDALVVGSDRPYSVIIVGVGNSDFSSMERLDGDDGKLKSTRGKKAWRDIVQFVAYNNCQGGGQLAKHTLAEVPKQLVDFFVSKNIKPNQPLPFQATATPVPSHLDPNAAAIPVVAAAPVVATATTSQQDAAALGKAVFVQAFVTPVQHL